MNTNPLVEALLNLSTSGDLVVLTILILLSVWATAVIIERFFYFRKFLPMVERSVGKVRSSLAANTVDTGWTPPHNSPVDDLFKTIWQDSSDPENVRARIRSAGGMFRRDLMRRTSILGTLGATAPFIGLLGTVFGIIQSFRDLAATVGRSSQAIMGGIAEALVATGMGLLVAIPCVLAYNYFSRRAHLVVEEVEEVAALLATVRRNR